MRLPAAVAATALPALALAALAACGGQDPAASSKQLTWYINPDGAVSEEGKANQAILEQKCSEASNGEYSIEVQTLPREATDQRQQLHGDQGEADPHHHRGGQADQDRLLALFLGQGGGGEAHGHGVVAGQHQVHQQDLAEGGRLAGEIGGGEEFHGRFLAATSRRAKRRTCSREHRQAC